MTVFQLVARERLRLGRTLALWGGALVVATVAVLLALGALALGGGRWMTLPALLPFIAWGAAAVGGIGLVIYTLRQVRARASTVQIAAAIERERRLRTGSLRGALEVGQSGALGRRGAKELATRLQSAVPRRGAALAPALHSTAARHAVVSCAIGALGLVSLGAAATSSPDGWRAVLHPIRAWRGTLLQPLRVLAPLQVPRGHEAHVRIVAPGRRRITVYTRATGAPWSSATYATPREAVEFTAGPVAAEVAIVATDGRSTSDTVFVRATDKPFIGGLALRALFPGYLHRPDEPLAAGEVARVPRGTRVAITGDASTPLASVELAHGHDRIELMADGRRFSGQIVADASGQWEWHAGARSGVALDVPAPLEFDVIPDSAPRVDILNPARDTVITPGDRVPVTITASDDHALASIVLESTRSPATGNSLPPVQQLVTDSALPQWNGIVTLDLSARGLQPGDVVRLMAVATDRSPWHQTGRSREIVLRVPSVAEQRTLARSAADSAVSAASATASAERQLAQRTEEAAHARGSRTGSSNSTSNASSPRSNMSYETAQRAKALANEQRDLGNRVQQVRQQTQELERKLKQAGALDSTLTAELHQAQQLLNDALTPELRDQLSKIEQSADSLRGGDTRQSLEQLAQQQQQLRQQLERSVDILKRAALEGSMQTLRDEARDIAKEERAQAGPSRTPSADPKSQQPQQTAAKPPNPQLQDSAGAKKADGGTPGQPRHDSTQLASADPPKANPGGQVQDSGLTSPQATPRTPTPSGPQNPDPQPTTTPSPSQPGARSTPQQLTERSRALSKDVDQLSKRLAQEKADVGAQQVGAARQHVDSSADAMSERQTSSAANQMDRAAQQLADARQQQIQQWKNSLTQELDKSIQETMQLARQENQLAEQAQQARDSQQKQAVQSGQSAVQQGAERTSERMQRASRQSALVSGNAQRALGQAQAQVKNATKQAEQQMASGATSNQFGSQSGPQSGSSGQQTSSAMRAAADALTQAAAAMMRDRARAGASSSASGMAEMLQELQQLARAQGSLNAQSQGLSMVPGGRPGNAPGNTPNPNASAVAQGQRKLAESLDRLGDDDATGRTSALATEAHQIADALSRSGVDQQTLVRQQRLYHRLLDAGFSLEQDERDSTGKRQAQAATGREQFTPGSAPVEGKAATRFTEPSWAELRGLTADERQLVLEYFKRINAQSP